MKNVMSLFFAIYIFALAASENVVSSSSVYHHSPKFPNYNLNSHPLNSLSPFNASVIQPVIMQSYTVRRENKLRVDGCIYSPHAASYATYLDGEHFGKDLDILVVSRTKSDEYNRDAFVKIQLNGEARAFLLLNGPGIGGMNLKGQLRLDGAPSNYWGNPVAIQHQGNFSDVPRLGNERRWGNKVLKAPYQTVSVEIPVSRTYSISLPHPDTLSINGISVSTFSLLFAKNETTITPFNEPTLPKPFKSFLPNGDGSRDEVNPADDPPMPNKACPKWLHDIQVTPGNVEIDGNVDEPRFWRTWHPQVDPVFWCYFQHEHGGFPGNYRPKFGYTAHKTRDDMEPTGRQNESHNGFKVFPFPVPGTDRVAIVTAHMKVSRARRFLTRHHTVILAVLNMVSINNWTLQMELSMKADFGPAQVTLSNHTMVPLDSAQVKIREELRARRVDGGRRFNVLNLDHFPSKVNQLYRTNQPVSAGLDIISRGIYESWRTPLNSCTWSRGMLTRGFNFEVRDPATAIKSLGKVFMDEEMQQLSGKSIKRILNMGDDGLWIARKFCSFDIFKSEKVVNLEEQHGTFYTDPYFSVVRAGAGNYSVRQFIHPGFQPVFIPPGLYTPVHPWNSWMEVDPDDEINFRRPVEIERSVDAANN